MVDSAGIGALKNKGFHLCSATKIYFFDREKDIRVDIDDRDLGLNKKIKNAEQEWIPYVVIIGQDEIQNSNISLRIRNEGEQKTSTDKSIECLEAKLSGFPKVPTNIPLFVSKQPDLSFR